MPANWGLTINEKRALLLICAAALLGTGYRLWQRRQPPVVAILSSLDSLAITTLRAAYSDSAANDAATARPASPRSDAANLEKENTIKTPNAQININSATAEQLDSLPGIGPVLAQRIIAEREKRGGFKRPEELLDVPGIGKRRFEQIRLLVICNPKKE